MEKDGPQHGNPHDLPLTTLQFLYICFYVHRILQLHCLYLGTRRIGTDAKQKVSELGNLNDSTLELRNFIVVLGIAFAPLILVVLFGFAFVAACSTVAYGVPMLFVPQLELLN